ncbi:LPXTG cell wall anchor domain-containing protein [Streptomyces sp. NPDC002577]
MSAARRSLLTATAAGTLLGALWFVPSANATTDKALSEVQRGATTATIRSEGTQGSAASSGTSVATTSTEESGTGARLADTGGIDTTPYVIGGTLFLGLGAGFVAYSVRRGRLEAC